ncbi:MAG: peptide chain release factor N(5)-glutamine methyltransferase [Bacillota bacterium]|nr:peptide chain release factor N(5)-glutamine methyltransferase [Bacillota bacterium]
MIKITQDSKPTVAQLLQWALSYNKIDRLDAEVLLVYVLGFTRTKLYAEHRQLVAAAQATQFKQLVEKRSTGYPLQYITGRQEFMSLDFHVREGVLIPRADTEVLVEQALQLLKEDTVKADTNDLEAKETGAAAPGLLVADVCTGSGAIGLSVAHYYPKAKVVLTDISPMAIEVASINREALGLKDRVDILQGDLLEPLEGLQLSMLLSNPPYISEQGWAITEESVKGYEPRLALWGGADGLDFYRVIAVEAIEVLKPGGYLLLEIGFDQGADVRGLLHQQQGYRNIRVVQDYGQRDRVVIAQKRE